MLHSKKQALLKPLAVALAALAVGGGTSAQTFTDVSSSAGFSGLNASWGMSLFDFNRDGWTDILTYSHLQEVTGSIGLQLWRNNKDGTFTDVTTTVGLFYLTGDTHGTAIGDIDGDGRQDIYLVNGSIKINAVDLDKLWLNKAAGFTEIGASAGVQGLEARGRGVYMFDANRDGRLDMFVTRFDRPDSKPFDQDKGNQLFLNNGDLTFTETGAAAGIDRSLAENRAAGWADYDGDGNVDLLVTGPCVLWRSNGDGTYSDVTAAAGIEASDECTAVGWADYDNDGDLDLYISRGFDTNTTDKLYRNNGNGTFTDATVAAGITATHLKRGVAWGDYDNDGDQDIYVVSLTNGSRPNLLYRNRGDGTFEEVGLAEGAANQVDGNGAAAAFVDYDNDGDLDIFVTNGEGNAVGPYTLLRNAGNANRWLQMNLIGKSPSNVDALGTKVKVTGSSGTVQYAWHLGPQHFLSQSSLPMHVGLGSDTGVTTLNLSWPNGAAQKVENIASNQRITLVQGKTVWQDAPVVSPAGLYLWQSGTRWTVLVKGTSPGVTFTGTVTAGANITSVTGRGLDPGDSATLTDARTVTFTISNDGRGADGFDFVTNSNAVTLNALQDGVVSPQTTYLGKYLVKPASLPAVLKR